MNNTQKAARAMLRTKLVNLAIVALFIALVGCALMAISCLEKMK